VKWARAWIAIRKISALGGLSLRQATWLDKEQALERLRAYPAHLLWTNKVKTYWNASEAQGVEATTNIT